MGIPSRLPSFLASCDYLASMMIGGATGLLPVLLLPAVGTQGQDLTIARAMDATHCVSVSPGGASACAWH
jgi:cytochrome bd ubiquinol oxidase subunit II